MCDKFVWPTDGSLETMRAYRRYEDMSPNGHICVTIEEEGDVHLSVTQGHEDGELLRPGIASVEFCTFGGGGQSTRTRNALLNLAKAIQEDNAERLQYRE